MTSPAFASFPWSQVPEPPSGEFRSGRLPALAGGGSYLAARGSRPGPALLILAGAGSGFPAVHGMFRLAGVLDAHRLAGSLLIGLAGGDTATPSGDLLEPADALLLFDDLEPGWRQLAIAGIAGSGTPELDRRAGRVAALSGAPYCYAGEPSEGDSDPISTMARLGRVAVRWRVPDLLDEREEMTERVFQGTINMLRALAMLEGQMVPHESREIQSPARAIAPVSGYWTPAARPGQRIRINDNLGSFRDAQGNELGDFLINISGILLGISTAVWVEAGQPVAELARPTDA